MDRLVESQRAKLKLGEDVPRSDVMKTITVKLRRKHVMRKTRGTDISTAMLQQLVDEHMQNKATGMSVRLR